MQERDCQDGEAGPQGRIEGFTSNLTSPNGKIVTIEAGDVGCPSMTP